MPPPSLASLLALFESLAAVEVLLAGRPAMLTNWFSQPAGSTRSPTEDGRVADNDDDTQVMEPDQGNGEMSPSPVPVLEPHGVGTSQQQLTSRVLQFSLTSSRNCGLAPTSAASSCPPSSSSPGACSSG
ncbi:Uncharacterized protein TCAP_06105 [Tolypocladium capitatum]|uniref:Secreted protein n=1 Tax=Tolypocladium capitatum TaxID=45235 RepID=A0A2K3Q8R9_9HYPO|nr:Uncharacterized protein TCAP_06105 [Tolypocladium capitatum]